MTRVSFNVTKCASYKSENACGPTKSPSVVRRIWNILYLFQFHALFILLFYIFIYIFLSSCQLSNTVQVYRHCESVTELLYMRRQGAERGINLTSRKFWIQMLSLTPTPDLIALSQNFVEQVIDLANSNLPILGFTWLVTVLKVYLNQLNL